jgi:hypothetical protein
LIIFHIPEKTLKNVTTTEKDRLRGQDKLPFDDFRYRGEDLLEEAVVQEKTEITNLTYEQGKALRDQQYGASK